MKRLLLLVAACGALTAEAQLLSLSGTSYTQNFNGLGGGLPSGWHVFIGATSTTIGIPYDTSSKLYLTPSGTTGWKSTAGGFKNFASANNSTTFSPYGADTASQNAATDRALGVRQVSYTSGTFPASDSGAAFVLTIANTTGLTGFNMTFKLQSLDSTSARTTTWRVDYGLGALPASFTAAATSGTLTTGGNIYSNNTVTVNFGSALNNQTGPVWIRIIATPASTGANNRASSAIDDVSLTWSGSAAGNPRPMIVGLSPTPLATGVPVSSNLIVTFDKAITAGIGNIYVRNRTAGTTQTISASSSNVSVSGKSATISGVTLQSGKTYHVTFDSTAFDSSSFHSMGLYDTTIWRFTTATVGVAQIRGASMPLVVVNPAAGGTFSISCTIAQAATLNAVVFDLAGRQVAHQSFSGSRGDNRLLMHTQLPAGTYIIRVDDGKDWGSVKATMQ